MRRPCRSALCALVAATALLLPAATGAPAALAAPAATGPANGLLAYGMDTDDSYIGWRTIRADGTDEDVTWLDPTWAWGVGSVDWSNDGTELAFSAEAEGTDAILVGEASGDPLWQVTNWDPAEQSEGDVSPTWGPDGSRLAFARHDAGTSVIAVSDAAGGFVEEITTGPDADPDWSTQGDLAFVRLDAPGGEPTGIWVLPDGGGPASEVVPGGRQPAFSFDGSRLAYVADTGGHAQLFVANADGSAPQQVTTSSVEHSAPVWSPDGTTLAFAIDQRLCTVPVAGGTETCLIDNPTGTVPLEPSWQPVPADPEPVVRLAGANREATALAVSHEAFPDDASADAVVLARSDNFPDALAGTPLAVARTAPLLLTAPSALSATVLAEINRVLDPAGSRTVYLLGGTGALSSSVEDAVEAAGWATKRLWGTTRFDTAVAVADEIGPVEQVFLATGRNFPDALGAGVAAGSYQVPDGGGAVVLLTSDRVLPAATSDYLTANPWVTVTTVGGQAAAAYPAADIEVVGGTREETASLLALTHFGAVHGAGISTSRNFPDALSAGPLLATRNYPLLLSGPAALAGPSREYLASFSASLGGAYLFGGTLVLSDAVAAAVGATIGLSWTSAPGAVLRSAAATATQRPAGELSLIRRPARVG